MSEILLSENVFSDGLTDSEIVEVPEEILEAIPGEVPEEIPVEVPAESVEPEVIFPDESAGDENGLSSDDAQLSEQFTDEPGENVPIPEPPGESMDLSVSDASDFNIESVATIDDILLFLQSAFPEREYSADDIYNLLSEIKENPSVFTEIRDSQLDLIRIMKAQNSILVIILIFVVMLSGFFLARLVWRKI